MPRILMRHDSEHGGDNARVVRKIVSEPGYNKSGNYCEVKEVIGDILDWTQPGTRRDSRPPTRPLRGRSNTSLSEIEISNI